MKKSFILHIDSLDILDDLTDQQVCELFRAIKSHQNKEEPTLSPMVKIAFSPFKNQFARDDEKYTETCHKRAIAGAKGGNKKVANASKCKVKVAKVATLAESVSDSKSVNVSDSKKEELLPENLKVSMPTDFELNDINKKYANDSNLTPTEKYDMVKDFIDYWVLEGSKKTDKGWQMAFRRNPIIKRKITSSKHRGQSNGTHQQTHKPSLAERATENRRQAERQIDEQSMGENDPLVRT